MGLGSEHPVKSKIAFYGKPQKGGGNSEVERRDARTPGADHGGGGQWSGGGGKNLRMQIERSKASTSAAIFSNVTKGP